jgi:multimeric flavodoxin WrbA
MEYELIDLLDHSIDYYNYKSIYSANDSFLELINRILEHQVIVFATPVYWYSMTGQLKNFFDRLTDLVTVHKIQGRNLKNKNVFLIAVGADKDLPLGFEVPFKSTCNYLDMLYGESFYYSVKYMKEEEVLKSEMDEFKNKLKKQIV